MAKITLLQWTNPMVCREFGMDSRTAGKRLAALELGKRKTYSTLEVFRALRGNMEQEKFELVREQKIRLRRENAEGEKSLVPIIELAQILNRAIAAAKGRVMSAANIEREDKDKICHELGELWSLAFGASPTDKAHVEPSPKVHSKRSGVPVPVSVE